MIRESFVLCTIREFIVIVFVKTGTRFEGAVSELAGKEAGRLVLLPRAVASRVARSRVLLLPAGLVLLVCGINSYWCPGELLCISFAALVSFILFLFLFALHESLIFSASPHLPV